MLRAPHRRLRRRCAGGFSPGAARARAPYHRSAAGSPADAASFSLTDRSADLSAVHSDARAHGDSDPNAYPQPDGHTDGNRDRDAHARSHT